MQTAHRCGGAVDLLYLGELFRQQPVFERNDMNKETPIHRRHIVCFIPFFGAAVAAAAAVVDVDAVVAPSLLYMPFVESTAYLRLNNCYRHRRCSTLIRLFSERYT